MSFSDDLFWGDVSGEQERLTRTSALVNSMVAASPYWPFLASATSTTDFENRLELSYERIAALVDPSVLPDVISSLRDNYRAVTAGKGDKMPWDKDDDDDSDADKKNKSEEDDADDKADDETQPDEDDDDDDSDDEGKSDSDKKKSGQPSWLKDKNKDESTTGGNTKEKKEATAYKPDPTAGWRYHQEYNSLEGLPLNNGDLQDADGFPKDLAVGEDRSNPKIQQEITPGTWSEGQGMPERPMPQGVERGYRPIASANLPGSSEENQHHYLTGYSHAIRGDRDQPNDLVSYSKTHSPEGATHYLNGWNDGRTELDARRLSRQADAMGHLSPLATRSHIDSEGFLVFEAVVDPVPGAPLASNPFYFSTDSQGLVGDAGFPVDPAAEPLADRANEYGDVQPQMSSGSTEGQSDGKGYSRTEPGNHAASRNFNRLASEEERGQGEDCPVCDGEGTVGNDRNERTCAHCNGSGKKTPLYLTSSLTDGVIVDHCPGCNVPRRKHSTMHGEELHHITNDHVRCHGGKTAAGLPELAEGAEEAHVPSFHVPPIGQHDSTGAGTGDGGGHSADTWADDYISSQSALNHGSNVGEHDHSLSFEEALAYTGGYGIANSADYFTITAGEYLGRPDANNPTGRGPDEYKARTWDAYSTQRPMQSAEDRNVNTPVLPSEPLKSREVNSPNPGENLRNDRLEQSGGEDEEEGED